MRSNIQWHQKESKGRRQKEYQRYRAENYCDIKEPEQDKRTQTLCKGRLITCLDKPGRKIQAQYKMTSRIDHSIQTHQALP